MQRQVHVWIVCAVHGFALVTYGQEAGSKQHPALAESASSAAISIRHHTTLRTTLNSSFAFVNLLNAQGSGYNTEILQMQQRNSTDETRDGIDGFLRVEAWSIKGNHRGRALWKFSQRANESNTLPDLGMLVATSIPCCSSMWVNHYYSLRSGKRLYVTNGAPATGEIPEVGLHRISGHAYKEWRYVAFGGSYEEGHRQPELQYGTDRTIQQRLVLKGHEYGDNFDVPEVHVLDEHGKPVRDLQGALTFTIVLRFSEGEQPAAEIQIPVEDDVLRPELAAMPKGYELIALKP